MEYLKNIYVRHIKGIKNKYFIPLCKFQIFALEEVRESEVNLIKLVPMALWDDVCVPSCHPFYRILVEVMISLDFPPDLGVVIVEEMILHLCYLKNGKDTFSSLLNISTISCLYIRDFWLFCRVFTSNHFSLVYYLWDQFSISISRILIAK